MLGCPIVWFYGYKYFLAYKPWLDSYTKLSQPVNLTVFSRALHLEQRINSSSMMRGVVRDGSSIISHDRNVGTVPGTLFESQSSGAKVGRNGDKIMDLPSSPSRWVSPTLAGLRLNPVVHHICSAK